MRRTSCADEMRFAAKRINFGLLYGMGAFSLGKELGVSDVGGEDLTSIPTSTSSPACGPASTASSAEARRTKEVTTLFGRVRPIPEIAASNARRARPTPSAWP